MRTSFHYQPEAQHPNFPLSTGGRLPHLLGRAGHAGIAGMTLMTQCRHVRLGILHANGDFEPHSAGPTPQPAAQHTKLPRAVIRHCHGSTAR